MPPGTSIDDWYTFLRSGLWRLHLTLSPESHTRFFTEFLPLLHTTKHATLGALRDNDSYYLVYIGTRPSARGKGYCRKLIEDVTRKADRERRCCYLESSNKVNVGIYRRLGFEVVSRIVLARGSRPVELDIMVREPVVKDGGEGEKKKKKEVGN